MVRGMECYFGSIQLPEGNELRKSAVVTFFIPEIGIRFKAPFEGVDVDHSDFASLLSLLEFIDGNQKYFSIATYQIFGNNLHIVNMVNKRESAPLCFAELIEKAERFRSKYNFSLDWVPARDNSAFDSLFD
jgi:hypothetical protein